ncbi:DNA-binding CsgD family transcriptional regulator [Bradyrhizobium sp. S3.2.6]
MPSRQLQIVPWYSETGNREGRKSVSRFVVKAATATPGQNLAALFATCAPLSALTPREQEVCRHILLGLGSEAISQALGISLHSTQTYRKRAYERLGISAQNE